MTTKVIREGLEKLKRSADSWAEDTEGDEAAYQAALEAVAAIEKMARTLMFAKVDEIRADGMPNAADLLERIAKEAP